MRSFAIAFGGSMLVGLLVRPATTSMQGWILLTVLAGGLAAVGFVAGWLGGRHPMARWSYAATVGGLVLLFLLDVWGAIETFWGATEETTAWIIVIWPLLVALTLGLGLAELVGYRLAAWVRVWTSRPSAAGQE